MCDLTIRKAVALLCFGLAQNVCEAQGGVAISSLSSFQNHSSSWHEASEVKSGFNASNLTWKDGAGGILINMPDSRNKGADLLTTFEHGDADIELEYLLTRGSNSGIYLQGRYELQLMDSWGVAAPTSADNGGIYQRWDESKPEGQKGYQGYAPRQNVSRAPGLWQRLRISFQAPRFDNNGQKKENAKLLRVELNGVVIHENLELFGPTRGALEGEKPTGPLRIQGDHGPIAIRNFVIHHYNKQRPQLSQLKYTIYKGRYEAEPDFAKLPPEAAGTTPILTGGLSNKIANEFIIRYTGVLSVKEAGEYTFTLSTPGGSGALKVNNQAILPMRGQRGRGRATLAAGELPFELSYSKTADWAKPQVGLSVSGPGIREFDLSDLNNAPADAVDPILVNAPTNTILRSFIDIPNTPRVTHAVSVGSPDGVHYTYDMDNGYLVQVWRGGFLNATPMWHERGDGSSRPTGSVLYLGKPALNLAKLSSASAAWPVDTIGSGFRTKGYALDDKDRPQFRYLVNGTQVTDVIQVTEGGQGFTREIKLSQPVAGTYVRIATGKNISDEGNNTYIVDDKAYYIRLDNTNGAKALIRDGSGGKELILPVQTNVKYSILF